ncbi:MAG: NEW3 domain-containing protein [Polyangiales bacterium]
MKALRFNMLGWLGTLAALFRRLLLAVARNREARAVLTRKQRRDSGTGCEPVRSRAVKRPDPLIYSQRYLRAQGFAVTWDNPDIQLFFGGAPVPSSALKPETEYDVVARIWNASTDAPVVAMVVELSFLTFGIGAASTAVGTTQVDIGVLGSPSNPSFAKFTWKTPPAAGHYCLQVRFAYPGDREPGNNLGQENTNVVDAHSPAILEFALRNPFAHEDRFTFHADAYTLPPRRDCDDERRQRPRGRVARELHRRVVAAAHAPERHTVPVGWRVEFEPPQPTLAPGESVTVRATVTPPDDFTGTQPLNISATGASGRLAGGVTTYVRRTRE